MRSLFRLYRFLRPYRLQAIVALLLLFGMVTADLVVPRLTQRIIDQGILARDLHVVITTALYMVGASIQFYRKTWPASGWSKPLSARSMKYRGSMTLTRR